MAIDKSFERQLNKFNWQSICTSYFFFSLKILTYFLFHMRETTIRRRFGTYLSFNFKDTRMILVTIYNTM